MSAPVSSNHGKAPPPPVPFDLPPEMMVAQQKGPAPPKPTRPGSKANLTEESTPSIYENIPIFVRTNEVTLRGPKSAEKDSEEQQMWNLQSVPEQYRATLEDAFDELVALNRPGETQWRDVVVKNDVVTMRANVEGSNIHCVRGIGEVDAPFDKIVDTVLSPAAKADWDPFFKKADVVEKFADDGDSHIRWELFETKKCIIKQSRDFCFIISKRKLGNRWVIAAKSLEHPDCPPIKGSKRSRLLASGWIIEAHPTRANASIVQYCAQVDLVGLPTKVVNIVATRQPLNVSRLRMALTGRKTLKEEKKKAKKGGLFTLFGSCLSIF